MAGYKRATLNGQNLFFDSWCGAFQGFLLEKMRLNPFYEAPLSSFKFVLLKWVKNAIPKALAVEEIVIDTHYRFDYVGSMAGLKEVINTFRLASFLQDWTRCGLHNTHIEGDPCCVEGPWLGDPHNWLVGGKCNFQRGHLCLRPKVIQALVHNCSQIRICNEGAVWVWSIHG